MKIAGIEKLTLLDYPGKIAAIVFTQGCNFACGYCHNSEMIPRNKSPKIDVGDFFSFLEKRRGFLDAVVVSGGEATLQPDLVEFIGHVKGMGFLVKLDTNGSNPHVLESLLEKSLLDYVAMDIKYAPESYKKYCRFMDFEALKRSIEILKNSTVDFEFRSTVLPAHHTFEELLEIAKLIKGADKWFLQRFRPNFTLDKRLASACVFSEQELADICDRFREYVGNVEYRI